MKLTLKDIVLFALFGGMMFVSKLLLEFLPNIHLIAMFITAFTVVYRWKGIFPISVFVFLTGLVGGFQPWWFPYLYIWTILWAVVLSLPKNMPKGIATVVYCAVCGLHGLCFGLLYAPAQAVLFGLDLKGTIAWIIAGLPFDFIHAVGNVLAGLLVVPIVTVLKKV